MMAGELILTVTTHRPIYPALQTPQQAYILLEAKSAVTQVRPVRQVRSNDRSLDRSIDRESGQSMPGQKVNLGMVLDRSGSMAGVKLHNMKAAAKAIIERLGPEDVLSITVFDDTADLIVPAGVVGDVQSLNSRIDAIQERGGTHMSTGMRLGLNELRRNLSPEYVSSMLLVTDGQTWEDESECQLISDQSREAGIPIYALGLGVGEESNWDPRLLEDLAQRSGGEWSAVEKPEDVSEAFAGTLIAMKASAVTNAYLTMRMVKGLTPRTVWRVSPLISRLGQISDSDQQAVVAMHDVQVFMGDIQYGVGQALLADVLLPPRKPGIYRLMQADIIYDVPDKSLTKQKVSTDVILKFSEDVNQAGPGSFGAMQTDQRLMNIIERVVAHRLQTQALDEAALGDRQKATQKLRAAATRLLELGESELAEQANQQAQQIEQVGQIDQAAAQRMRYATKKLTQTDDIESG